jgi:multiple sugar transport system permease protein/lactose/L-arabinose transport system permease protein
MIMAAATMAVAPLIIVFMIFQKFLVKGLQMGGVKG